MNDKPALEEQPNTVKPTEQKDSDQIPPSAPKATKNKWLVLILVIVVILTIGAAGFVAYQNYQSNKQTSIPQPTITSFPSPTSDTKNQEYQELLKQAKNKGTIRIIVGLDVDFIPEGELDTEAVNKQRQVINQAREQLLESLSEYNIKVLSENWIIPFIGLSVDEQALQAIINSPLVKGVEEDKSYILSN